MLTDNQREMIKERKIIHEKIQNVEKFDPERKKYIDYTLRNYAKKQLDAIGDVLEVLSVLPGKQIKTLITADRIIGVLDLLKKISFDLAPIELDAQGNPHAVYRFKIVIKLDKPVNGKDTLINTMKYMFPATPDEVEMAKKLEPYMSTLGKLFETEDDAHGYTMDGWNKYGTFRLHDIMIRRGQSFKLDIDESYIVAVEKVQKSSDMRTAACASKPAE